MADILPSAQVRTLTATHPGESARATLTRGDHIKVSRTGYSHHGVYVGNDEVIHYSGEKKAKTNAVICRVSTAEFSQDGEIKVVCYNDGECVPPEKVVQRAELYLGSMRFKGKPYSTYSNNCEHFARWCKTGEAESKQIQRAATTTGGIVAVGRILPMVGSAFGSVGRIIGLAIGGAIGFLASTDTSKKADTEKGEQ